MAGRYVENGYAEYGYAEGDIPVGNYNMRFFVQTSGDDSEIQNFVNASDSNIALVVGLGGLPMKIVTKEVEDDIVSKVADGLEEKINSLINKVKEYESRIGELESTVEDIKKFTLVVTSNDDEIFSGAAEKVDETTYKVTIPEEMVATEYNIVVKWGT